MFLPTQLPGFIRMDMSCFAHANFKIWSHLPKGAIR